MNNNGTITGLISSNPNAVSVSLVADPSNSNNALIQVTPTANSNSIIADQPVVITAFTSNGKSASITLNLKKAAVLDNFTLMAPSTTVSAGDNNVIIPFTAVDQNGATLTKYSDINNAVTFSGTITPTLVQNPDGTASLQLNVPSNAVQSPLTSQSYTVQAVTKSSGKFSSLNIVVQAVAVPNTLSVTNTVAVPNMESGAVQNLDFGTNFADLAVKDQYGRVMDMTNQDTTTAGDVYYYVLATAPAGSSVTVNPNANKAYDAMNIQLVASGAAGSGSTTVTYTVMKHVNGTDASTDIAVPGLTPTTAQYTVVGTTDIKDYTVGTIAPLYDIVGATAKQSYIGSANSVKFENSANVYGLTSGGGKVALANADIIAASVDNSGDFVANLSNNYNGTAQVSVYANNTLSSTKPTSTGKLAVAIKSADGLIHTVTTAINSKDDMPVASSVAFTANRAISTAAASSNVYASPAWNDINVSGNNMTMSANNFNTGVAGHLVSKYSPDGNTASDSLVYLYAVDQYGTETAPITTLSASAVDASGNAISGLSVTNGVLTAPALAAGDVVTINGVTSNGLIQSVNITLK